MKVSSSEGGRLYPLLWKEVLESRLAIVFGILWVCSAIAFWLEHLKISVPSAAHSILNIVGMTAPLVCVLLLSVTRFAIERKRGTWEFLRALPISQTKVYAAKWIVAVGLGMLFMAGSSGIAW